MDEPAENSLVHDALLWVMPPHLTKARWAESAGFARNIFNDIRRHGNPKSQTLDRLLLAAGISSEDFTRAMEEVQSFRDSNMPPAVFKEMRFHRRGVVNRDGAAVVRTDVTGAGIVGDGEVRRAMYGEGPTAKLPVLGSAMGGEYGDLDQHIEMTELHLAEVLDYLARPASLANDQEAYALTIVGDSMHPRFKPGERAAVSPRAPVSIGDDVIVQLRGPEDDGERIKLVLIKELARRTASFIELKQYNPEVTFRIEAERVAAMHKVTGRLF